MWRAAGVAASLLLQCTLAASVGDVAPQFVMQKGMHFLGKSFEGTYAYDSPQALQSLENLAAAGVTHITLTFSWYMNITAGNTGPIVSVEGPAPSGVIYANCSSPSDAELTTIIAAAHKLNLSVKLRPTVDPYYKYIPSCTPKTASHCPARTGIGGGFSAEQWVQFFEGKDAYGDYVLHMAALAQRTGCEIFSVNVELTTVTHQEQHMRNLIAKVRKVYTGIVHNDYAGAGQADFGLSVVKYWDAVDAIGVDSYPALTYGIPANVTNPSVEQLVAAFEPFVDRMYRFYYGLPPAPPPPPPPTPPCGLGQHIFNYSNTRPWSLGSNPDGPNNAHVQYIGTFESFEECEQACRNSPSKNCTSWVWHNHDGTAWDGHCYKRSDGQWMPVATTNDVSGRVNDTVHPDPPSPPPAPPAPPHNKTWWPAKVNMPIFFAEDGGCSANNMFRGPGGFYNVADPRPACLQCQENYYEATLQVIFCNPKLRPFFSGVYWWKWSTDPDPWGYLGAGNNSDFYPQHKPAQDILEKYYKHGCPHLPRTDDNTVIL